MGAQAAGWQNFYVIVGSSAGALIGLQFVVIAFISSSSRTEVPRASIRGFASPTIVFFSSVLIIAGVMNVPDHTETSLGSLLLALGVFGLFYVGWAAMHMRRQEIYAPDLGDWLWYALLPAVTFAGVLSAGVVAWSSPHLTLVLIASSAMLLLLVGVHNAWDAAVWMIANPTEQNEGTPLR